MFSEWIIKIIGLGALGVLLDVLIAEGETSKYIKGIFGIITVFVLFSPLPKLLNIDFKVDDVITSGSEIEIDDDYLYYVQSKKWETYEDSLTKILSQKYDTDCVVDIKFVESCPEKIDVVFVYFKNDVIAEFDTNKHRIEVVKEVQKALSIDENLVVVRYE